jgi:hypothetical protein
MRDYQVDIVNNFLANPQCLQEVATGAGKVAASGVKAKAKATVTPEQLVEAAKA